MQAYEMQLFYFFCFLMGAVPILAYRDILIEGWERTQLNVSSASQESISFVGWCIPSS
jgi:hypothetical protein